MKRGGLSYTNIVTLSDPDDRYKLGLIPILAFVFDDTGVEGGGFALPVCLWLPKSENAGVYFGAGPGVGVHSVSDGADEWGWGIELNAGMAMDLLRWMSVNIEIVGVVEGNSRDEETDFIIGPGINVGVTF
jgi:hypothetical protein